MTVFDLILAVIIASYLRDILDGIILGIYQGITGKRVKEFTVKWSKK